MKSWVSDVGGLPEELTTVAAFCTKKARDVAASLQFLPVENKNKLMSLQSLSDLSTSIRSFVTNNEIEGAVETLVSQKESLAQLRDAITEAVKSLRRGRAGLERERLNVERSTCVMLRQAST